MSQTTDYSYGRWCTVGGKRFMITDSTKWSVVVHNSEDPNVPFRFDKSVVSEVSDFMTTDAERKAAGYAF